MKKHHIWNFQVPVLSNEDRQTLETYGALDWAAGAFPYLPETPFYMVVNGDRRKWRLSTTPVDNLPEISPENISSVWELPYTYNNIPLKRSDACCIKDIHHTKSQKKLKYALSSSIRSIDTELFLNNSAYDLIDTDSNPVPMSIIKKLKYRWSKHERRYIHPNNAIYCIVEMGNRITRSFVHASRSVVSVRLRNGRVDMCLYSTARNNGYEAPSGSSIYLKGYETPNAGYHALSEVPRKWKCKKDTHFTVGFEIEKEDSDAVKIGYKKLFEETKWCKERDGSLNGDTGYELITPIYDLFGNEMDNDIEGSQKLKKLINAKTNAVSCGGHINIGSSIYSPMQLFWGMKGFFPLIYALYPQRVSEDRNVEGRTNYAVTKEVNKYIFDERGFTAKYSAFYIKEKVLEIRIVSAVKSVKNLMWRRDLMRIILKNINTSEKDVLKMLMDNKSELHNHLRTIFSDQKMVKKYRQFVSYCDVFNHIRLDDNNIGPSNDNSDDLDIA